MHIYVSLGFFLLRLHRSDDIRVSFTLLGYRLITGGDDCFANRFVWKKIRQNFGFLVNHLIDQTDPHPVLLLHIFFLTLCLANIMFIFCVFVGPKKILFFLS
jgi:hypothetical protein